MTTSTPIRHLMSCDVPQDLVWEDAYRRFEDPETEARKFVGRLRKLGAGEWSERARILEIFCGRASGLVALNRLGFKNVEGLDLSESLLSESRAVATALYVADCRDMQLEGESYDVVIAQGGLHHLPSIPIDLERCVSEVHRVLRTNGKFVVVEPWDTSFLQFVHRAIRFRPLRKVVPKIDALHIMIEQEAATYFAWLSKPRIILDTLTQRFRTEHQCIGWGKLNWCGIKSD
ncbi:MAG: class I SAM-dependent methyltransferase [Pseudomonadales bacterium]